MSISTRKLVSLSIALSAASMAFSASAGTRTGAMSDAQARYQQDRAACMTGQSNQDRATCLKEAGAALAEARRGNLNDAQGQTQGNATDRCKVLAGAERSDCLARMRGEGTTEGSVAGGGILREKVTIVPGNPSVQMDAEPKK